MSKKKVLSFLLLVTMVFQSMVISTSTVMANQTTTYQAESYTSQSGCIVKTANTGYTGSGYIDYGDSGTYVEWNNVNVSAAGVYTLTFRYSNGSSTYPQRQCELKVNGSSAGNLNFNQTSSWTEWNTESVNVNLRAGNNTIRLTANTSSGGPNFDKMDVALSTPAATATPAATPTSTPTQAPSSTPTPTTAATPPATSSPVVYQAENYTSQSGCSVKTSSTGYTGTGYIDYGDSGTYVEWNNVNVSTAGVYTLTFRYSNGSSTSPQRQCELKVNGSSAGNLSFNQTSSWTEWNTESVNVNLRAGNNTIRLTANTSIGGPNFDKMDVALSTPSATATPAATPTPTAVPTMGPTPTPTATVTPVPSAVNLASNKAVTASSQSSGYEATKVVDGSTSTRWSTNNYPQWIRIDLGTNYSINRTEMLPYDNRAYKYKVEVSTDGTSYTTVVDRTDNTASNSVLSDYFPAASARYVRFTITGCSGYTGTSVSINEIRVNESQFAAQNLPAPVKPMIGENLSDKIPGLDIPASVDEVTGALTTEFSIDIPEYYGIEPSLSLSYNSNAYNDICGVGWSLRGIPQIQRGSKIVSKVSYFNNLLNLNKGIASPMGAPSFSSEDSYYFDGEPLIESTEMGGTHCTKYQNYKRITFDSANNKWYVYNENGTKYTFSPSIDTSLGTYIWSLTSAQDVFGNTVNYYYTTLHTSPWSYITKNDKYVDRIEYNGTIVKFHYEDRLDHVENGITAGIDSTKKRLKTIEIKAGNTRIGAYKLSYGSSTSNKSSVLISIQEFGTDAVLDASGTITGGTCMPPVTMFVSYAHPSGSLNIAQSSGPYTVSSSAHSFTGDVNGDGLTDIIYASEIELVSRTRLCVAINNGNGSYTYSQQDTDVKWDSRNYWFAGDLNHDFKSDIMGVTYHPYDIPISYEHFGFETFISQGDGTFTDGPSNCSSSPWSEKSSWFPGDFNGDGKMDFMGVYPENGKVSMTTATITPDNSFTFILNRTTLPWNDKNKWHVGDVNSDGRFDLIGLLYHTPDAYVNKNHIGISACISDGEGFYTPVTQETDIDYNDYSTWISGEINGDGKTDLIGVYSNPSNPSYAKIYTLKSVANGTFLVSSLDSTMPWNIDNHYLSGDINGDGISDILGSSQNPPDGVAAYSHMHFHMLYSMQMVLIRYT